MTFGNYFDGIEDLNDSSTTHATADDINENSEITACAMLINSAAKAGQYSVLYQHMMSDELKSTLESNGYTIEELPDCAIPGSLSVISW